MSELPATITEKAPFTSKYDDLIKMLMKDKDFMKLPLPNEIRTRFDIPLECKEISLKAAVTAALSTRHDNYTGFELRDQTDADIAFPPLPPSEPPTESTETKPQELEGLSSPPAEHVAPSTDGELSQQFAFAQ
jgi:hypothetical protein